MQHEQRHGLQKYTHEGCRDGLQQEHADKCNDLHHQHDADQRRGPGLQQYASEHEHSHEHHQ